MQLIDDWQQTLKKSYAAWLGYIATACGTLLVIVSMAPPGTLTPEFVAWVSPWLTWIGLIAGALVSPARVIHQPNIAPKG